MKKVTLKVDIIILLLLLIGGGCQKAQDEILIWEISPDSQKQFIQNEVDGIEFMFYLINELGERTTVLKENENFTFCFSFKNNKKNKITVTTEFINNNFFRVFRSEDDLDMGIPWTGVWCNFSLAPQVIEVAKLSRKSLSCPWVLTESDQPTYPLCMAESKSFMEKNEYYTGIKLNFRYYLDGKRHIINNIVLKINFIIQ